MVFLEKTGWTPVLSVQKCHELYISTTDKLCRCTLNVKLPWKVATALCCVSVCLGGVNYHCGDPDSPAQCLKDVECNKENLWCELGIRFAGWYLFLVNLSAIQFIHSASTQLDTRIKITVKNKQTTKNYSTHHKLFFFL